jgi:hypothetical protein
LLQISRKFATDAASQGLRPARKIHGSLSFKEEQSESEVESRHEAPESESAPSAHVEEPLSGEEELKRLLTTAPSTEPVM